MISAKIELLRKAVRNVINNSTVDFSVVVGPQQKREVPSIEMQFWVYAMKVALEVLL